MRFLSPAADDSDAGEVWDSLGELTDVAIENMRYVRGEVASVLGIPLLELNHVLLDGGSIALAEQVIRLAEVQIADLTWVVKDLRATRDRAAAAHRLTGEVLP